ncbi:MAG: DNA primase [Candidatus Aminicenantes bacterium]|nr:DNA primase [Candidatus Aminicenantes bacterium]
MDVRDQIKSRLSITEVAGLYVDLKPAGKNLKALCPFHTEKTPSFFVMPDKNSFTCYGCNKFGDIFTLVQEMENLSFPEAMNFLSEKFNIPVDKTNRQKSIPTDVYTGINEIALKYFNDNLSDSPEGKQAMNYLRQRGISADTIRIFSLGYAENRWDGLSNHLRRQSCDMAKAVELGLVIRNPQKNSVYDRFRGRIIFPIYSESGALIAFGGRTIFDDPSKYLNSPDTPLYKKSNHLYGFNHAKDMIREKKSVVLVEGYFDMVSLYQNGAQNVVASLGTALTEQQIYLLKRFCDAIYIYYDSDKAGIAAAVRAIEKMFEQNINPYIIAAADAKDPDDLIRQKGLKAFLQLLEQADDGFKFLLSNIARKYDLKIPERKNQAVESLMGFIDKFGEPIIKDEYIRMAADYFQVDEKNLKLKLKFKDKPASAALTGEGDAGAGGLDITPAERIFLESIVAMPELIEQLDGVLDSELLSLLAGRNIIRLLLGHYNPHDKQIEDYGKIGSELNAPERVELRNIFNSSERIVKDKEHLGKNIEASVSTFADMLNRRKFKQLDQRIKIAERENNMPEALRLMTEKNKHIKNKFNIDMNANKNTGGAVERPQQ